MLQELNEVVHDTLVADLQLETLVELGGIVEGLETLLTVVWVGCVGEELGQAEQSILLVEVILQVDDHVGEDRQTVQLNLALLGR